MAAFISNPCRGAINPDTIEGKKMIAKMTAGLTVKDRFDMKRENTAEFKDNLEEAVNVFYYGCVMHAILIEHDENGDIVETANLLTETNQCALEKVMDFHSKSGEMTMETTSLILTERQRRM